MCERNIMAVKKHKIRSACNMYLSEKVHIVICQPCQAHLVKKKQNFNGKCKVGRYFRLDVTVLISRLKLFGMCWIDEFSNIHATYS